MGQITAIQAPQESLGFAEPAVTIQELQNSKSTLTKDFTVITCYPGHCALACIDLEQGNGHRSFLMPQQEPQVLLGYGEPAVTSQGGRAKSGDLARSQVVMGIVNQNNLM